MLCGNLDERGVLGRMDTCICMAKSLCCQHGTITTLLIGYTPIQNKKLRKTKTTEPYRETFITTSFHSEISRTFCQVWTALTGP